MNTFKLQQNLFEIGQMIFDDLKLPVIPIEFDNKEDTFFHGETKEIKGRKININLFQNNEVLLCFIPCYFQNKIEDNFFALCHEIAHYFHYWTCQKSFLTLQSEPILYLETNNSNEYIAHAKYRQRKIEKMADSFGIHLFNKFKQYLIKEA